MSATKSLQPVVLYDSTGAVISTLPVSAASLPLPSGASTETTLAALNSLVTTLNGLVTAIRDTAGIKKITDQLPAGTNNIGDVDVLSSALPTGASTEATLATRVAATQVPASLVGGRLDTNNGAWLGSTAPTVGQKTMANAIPVVFASDQSSLPVSGATDEKTFTVVASAVTLGNNKSLLSIYNPTGATQKIKLREFYIRNSQSTAVTGVIADFQLKRWANASAPTGGTALTARAHDTADTLTESVVCHTGATIGGTEETQSLDLMRISTDDWGTGTADVESNQQAFANYLPARALSSTVLKAFTARPGEGLHMKMATNTAVSTVDIIFVFTQA